MKKTGSPLIQEFAAGKDPFVRGALTAALNREKFFIEGRIMPIGAFVKIKVGRGWVITKDPQGRRQLVSPAGKGHYVETELTSTGMDYAEFLLKKRRSSSKVA